jgi:hypothetical protein
MRRLIPITVFCALWLACATPAASQSAGQGGPTRKTKVKVRYGKAKDLTTVSLEPLTVWSATGEARSPDSVDLSAAFNYPGHTIATPKAVVISITARNQTGTQFSHERDLTVIADDVRSDLGKMELAASHVTPRGQVGGGGVWAFEVLRLSIPFQDWLRMADATGVKIQVGGRKFELSGKILQSLRDFAELMRQEGQEFRE